MSSPASFTTSGSNSRSKGEKKLKSGEDQSLPDPRGIAAFVSRVPACDKDAATPLSSSVAVMSLSAVPSPQSSLDNAVPAAPLQSNQPMIDPLKRKLIDNSSSSTVTTIAAAAAAAADDDTCASERAINGRAKSVTATLSVSALKDREQALKQARVSAMANAVTNDPSRRRDGSAASLPPPVFQRSLKSAVTRHIRYPVSGVVDAYKPVALRKKRIASRAGGSRNNSDYSSSTDAAFTRRSTAVSSDGGVRVASPDIDSVMSKPMATRSHSVALPRVRESPASKQGSNVIDFGGSLSNHSHGRHYECDDRKQTSEEGSDASLQSAESKQRKPFQMRVVMNAEHSGIMVGSGNTAPPPDLGTLRMMNDTQRTSLVVNHGAAIAADVIGMQDKDVPMMEQNTVKEGHYENQQIGDDNVIGNTIQPKPYSHAVSGDLVRSIDGDASLDVPMDQNAVSKDDDDPMVSAVRASGVPNNVKYISVSDVRPTNQPSSVQAATMAMDGQQNRIDDTKVNSMDHCSDELSTMTTKKKENDKSEEQMNHDKITFWDGPIGDIVTDLETPTENVKLLVALRLYNKRPTIAGQTKPCRSISEIMRNADKKRGRASNHPTRPSHVSSAVKSTATIDPSAAAVATAAVSVPVSAAKSVGSYPSSSSITVNSGTMASRLLVPSPPTSAYPSGSSLILPGSDSIHTRPASLASARTAVVPDGSGRMSTKNPSDSSTNGMNNSTNEVVLLRLGGSQDSGNSVSVATRVELVPPADMASGESNSPQEFSDSSDNAATIKMDVDHSEVMIKDKEKNDERRGKEDEGEQEEEEESEVEVEMIQVHISDPAAAKKEPELRVQKAGVQSGSGEVGTAVNSQQPVESTVDSSHRVSMNKRSEGEFTPETGQSLTVTPGSRTTPINDDDENNEGNETNNDDAQHSAGLMMTIPSDLMAMATADTAVANAFVAASNAGSSSHNTLTSSPICGASPTKVKPESLSPIMKSKNRRRNEERNLSEEGDNDEHPMIKQPQFIDSLLKPKEEMTATISTKNKTDSLVASLVDPRSLGEIEVGAMQPLPPVSLESLRQSSSHSASVSRDFDSTMNSGFLAGSLTTTTMMMEDSTIPAHSALVPPLPTLVGLKSTKMNSNDENHAKAMDLESLMINNDGGSDDHYYGSSQPVSLFTDILRQLPCFEIDRQSARSMRSVVAQALASGAPKVEKCDPTVHTLNLPSLTDIMEEDSDVGGRIRTNSGISNLDNDSSADASGFGGWWTGSERRRSDANDDNDNDEDQMQQVLKELSELPLCYCETRSDFHGFHDRGCRNQSRLDVLLKELASLQPHHRSDSDQRWETLISKAMRQGSESEVSPPNEEKKEEKGPYNHSMIISDSMSMKSITMDKADDEEEEQQQLKCLMDSSEQGYIFDKQEQWDSKRRGAMFDGIPVSSEQVLKSSVARMTDWDRLPNAGNGRAYCKETSSVMVAKLGRQGTRNPDINNVNVTMQSSNVRAISPTSRQQSKAERKAYLRRLRNERDILLLDRKEEEDNKQEEGEQDSMKEKDGNEDSHAQLSSDDHPIIVSNEDSNNVMSEEEDNLEDDDDSDRVVLLPETADQLATVVGSLYFGFLNGNHSEHVRHPVTDKPLWSYQDYLDHGDYFNIADTVRLYLMKEIRLSKVPISQRRLIKLCWIPNDERTSGCLLDELGKNILRQTRDETKELRNLFRMIKEEAHRRRGSLNSSGDSPNEHHHHNSHHRSHHHSRSTRNRRRAGEGGGGYRSSSGSADLPWGSATSSSSIYSSVSGQNAYSSNLSRPLHWRTRRKLEREEQERLKADGDAAVDSAADSAAAVSSVSDSERTTSKSKKKSKKKKGKHEDDGDDGDGHDDPASSSLLLRRHTTLNDHSESSSSKRRKKRKRKAAFDADSQSDERDEEDGVIVPFVKRRSTKLKKVRICMNGETDGDYLKYKEQHRHRSRDHHRSRRRHRSNSVSSEGGSSLSSPLFNSSSIIAAATKVTNMVIGSNPSSIDSSSHSTTNSSLQSLPPIPDFSAVDPAGSSSSSSIITADTNTRRRSKRTQRKQKDTPQRGSAKKQRKKQQKHSKRKRRSMEDTDHEDGTENQPSLTNSSLSSSISLSSDRRGRSTVKRRRSQRSTRSSAKRELEAVEEADEQSEAAEEAEHDQDSSDQSNHQSSEEDATNQQSLDSHSKSNTSRNSNNSNSSSSSSGIKGSSRKRRRKSKMDMRKETSENSLGTREETLSEMERVFKEMTGSKPSRNKRKPKKPSQPTLASTRPRRTPRKPRSFGE